MTVSGTLTDRFELLKPTLDAQDVWGGELNLNLDKIDAAAKLAELVTISGHLQSGIDGSGATFSGSRTLTLESPTDSEDLTFFFTTLVFSKWIACRQ